MSLSECSSAKDIEFAYYTRVIVYKFLGLVPTQGISQNESNVTTDDNNGNTSGSIPWELSSLPQVSLIDKLKDSEEYFAKNKSVCDELRQKVKRVSSESPKGEYQRSSRSINNSNLKTYQEVLPQSLLHEIKLRGKLNTDIQEDNLQPLTVIQKQARVKVFIDPSRNQGTCEFSPNQNLFTIHGSRGGSMELLDDPDSDVDDGPVNPQTPVLGTNVSLMQKSLARQSSRESRRLNTYVDVGDVDDETLRSFKTLPSSVIPLKREISEVLSQLESDYNSQIQSLQNQYATEVLPAGTSQAHSRSDNLLLDEDAVSHVAEQLRVLGDRLQGEYVEQNINRTVDELVNQFYAQEESLQQRFRESIQSLLDGAVPGWTRVALMLSVGQRLLLRLLETGSARVVSIGELLAHLVHELVGDFILNNGGWLGFNELTPFEPLDISSDEILNWNETEDNGILEHSGEINSASDHTLTNLKSHLTSESDIMTIKNYSTNESDTGVNNNSQGLPSTPIEEHLSAEMGMGLMDDGHPEQSVDKKNEKPVCMVEREENKNSRSKTSLDLFQQPSGICVETVDGNFRSDPENFSCNSARSAFDFLVEYISSPQHVFKLSVLVCSSILFWEYVVKRTGR